MNQSATLFESYGAFIKGFVQPLADRGFTRLDGEPTGSSRRVAAYLMFQGRRFMVHEDARIAALLRPLEVSRKYGVDIDSVMIIARTRSIGSDRYKIKLKDEYGYEKGFYIYQIDNGVT